MKSQINIELDRSDYPLMHSYKISLSRKEQNILLPFQVPYTNLIREMFEDPLYVELVESNRFQRLFGIPFLGGLSYTNDKKEIDTRGDHSIGVAILIYYFCKKFNSKINIVRNYVCSALLHDIHHLPFSHTMEIALKTQLPNFSLIKETERILNLPESDSGRNIIDMLEKYDINALRLPLFDSKEYRPLVFGCTHNVDTLEGITRSNLFFNMDKDISSNLPIQILEVFIHRKFNRDATFQDLSILDKFWELKNNIYKNGIYEARRILFERILAFYLFDICKKNNLLPNLTDYSDGEYFSLFPDLQNKIKRLWGELFQNCLISTIAKDDNKQEYFTGSQISENQKRNANNLKLQIQSRQFKINYREVISSANRPRGIDRYLVKPLLTVENVHGNIVKQAERLLEFELSQSKYQYIAKEMDDNMLL